MTRTVSFGAVAACVCACGSPLVPNTSFKGVIAGEGGDTGVITATRVEHEFAVHATLLKGSQSQPLSGSLDPVGGLFQLSGGGYNFNGSLKNGVLTGTYTGPGGNGRFALQQSDAVAAVFCGTFTGAASATGVFDVVQGSAGSLQAAFAGSSLIGLASGTVSGSGFSATDSSSSTTVTGTIENGTATGTWAAAGANGTFMATTAACPK